MAQVPPAQADCGREERGGSISQLDVGVHGGLRPRRRSMRSVIIRGRPSKAMAAARLAPRLFCSRASTPQHTPKLSTYHRAAEHTLQGVQEARARSRYAPRDQSRAGERTRARRARARMHARSSASHYARTPPRQALEEFADAHRDVEMDVEYAADVLSFNVGDADFVLNKQARHHSSNTLAHTHPHRARLSI